MRVRKHIYINGMVQAVFFRFETSRVAKENNVRGWIRNLPDGRVEAVLEGETYDGQSITGSDQVRVVP